MKPKSLGQIAHNFWWKDRKDIKWEDLPPSIKYEWDQMANAVAREVRRRIKEEPTVPAYQGWKPVRMRGKK